MLQESTPAPFTSRPKISIVIPTFNAGQTLGACLRSISEQTYQDIEVLILDALSSDDTLDIAKDFAGRFKFIAIFAEADSGIYDAMNKGLQRAEGEWLYFLGADDRLCESSTIENVVRHLNVNTDLFYGNVFHEGQNRIIGGPFDIDRILEKTICHQAMFYRKTLCDTVGHFNLDFKVCADWDYNLRCLSKTKQVRYADVTVCNYSGTGFSSVTEDEHFHENKYRLAAKYFAVGMLNRLFTICRYAFHKKAVGLFLEKQWLKGGYFYGLYLFHAVRNKIAM